jgi:hypothetical protein
MFPNAGDREAATKLFARRVGHDTIWSKVSEGPGLDDLNCLRTLIAPVGGKFYLFVHSGTLTPDRRKNEELYRQLTSSNLEERVNAILIYLYRVRCNIFHGTKGLDPDQREILRPSIRCLRRILRLGMDSLKETIPQ